MLTPECRASKLANALKEEKRVRGQGTDLWPKEKRKMELDINRKIEAIREVEENIKKASKESEEVVKKKKRTIQNPWEVLRKKTVKLEEDTRTLVAKKGRMTIKCQQ